MSHDLKGWLTFRGAAEKVGVAPSVVTRAAKSGRLKYFSTDDEKSKLIHINDLLAWKAQAKAGRPEVISNCD